MVLIIGLLLILINLLISTIMLIVDKVIIEGKYNHAVEYIKNKGYENYCINNLKYKLKDNILTTVPIYFTLGLIPGFNIFIFFVLYIKYKSFEIDNIEKYLNKWQSEYYKENSIPMSKYLIEITRPTLLQLYKNNESSIYEQLKDVFNYNPTGFNSHKLIIEYSEIILFELTNKIKGMKNEHERLEYLTPAIENHIKLVNSLKKLNEEDIHLRESEYLNELAKKKQNYIKLTNSILDDINNKTSIF